MGLRESDGSRSTVDDRQLLTASLKCRWAVPAHDSWIRARSVGSKQHPITAIRSIQPCSENLHTWTGGFDNVTCWNAYVANLQMHGKGNFNDERFNNPAK